MCSFMNKAASFVAFIKKIFNAFFGIHKDDDIGNAGIKVTHTLLRRMAYGIADYWLMAASAIFIIMMDRQFGYGPAALFLLMWAFDLAVANVFIVIWKRTGEDVTLGESYRRAADAIYSDSRIAGRLAFVSVVAKATFWDGPEHIVIFFNKEIRTEFRMLLILLVLTGIQAAIWTPVYVLGFETGAELYTYGINRVTAIL